MVGKVVENIVRLTVSTVFFIPDSPAFVPVMHTHGLGCDKLLVCQAIMHLHSVGTFANKTLDRHVCETLQVVHLVTNRSAPVGTPPFAEKRIGLVTAARFLTCCSGKHRAYQCIGAFGWLWTAFCVAKLIPE